MLKKSQRRLTVDDFQWEAMNTSQKVTILQSLHITPTPELLEGSTAPKELNGAIIINGNLFVQHCNICDSDTTYTRYYQVLYKDADGELYIKFFSVESSSFYDTPSPNIPADLDVVKIYKKLL